jgi:hypothetical protein
MKSAPNIVIVSVLLMKKIVHYSSYSLSFELADALESGNGSNTPSLKLG